LKLSFVHEPELQFCDGPHVDIRAGITQYGTLDRDVRRTSALRVGLVATPQTQGPLREWLERCSAGLVSTESRLVDLRPNFPGMTEATFGSRFELNENNVRCPTKRELETALAGPRPMKKLVEMFLAHARDLATRGGLDVLIIAPSVEIFDLGDPRPLGVPPPPADLQPLDDGADPDPNYRHCFHDLFKAQALRFRVPCQLIRPDTYGGGKTRRSLRKRRLQDEATRAWNFFSALYYKGGAIPWRLVRDQSALTSCYVGVSFFKTIDKQRVLASIAQIFDERGEGLVVLGGRARIDSEDRSPHLTGEDMAALLADTLDAYQREHRTLPARLVVHKTSVFDEAELDGARSVMDSYGVQTLDLISIRRSEIRLFRDAIYPVLRGTTLTFDQSSGIVYLRGSVPQFRVYPGMYVPSSLEYHLAYGEVDSPQIAKELVALSKLNFNSTQFDCGEPVTIRAARRVGDILKHVGPDEEVNLGFRFFT